VAGKVKDKMVSPVKAEDPEVEPLIRRCVLEKKTLTASFCMDALAFADVVVVAKFTTLHMEIKINGIIQRQAPSF